MVRLAWEQVYHSELLRALHRDLKAIKRQILSVGAEWSERKAGPVDGWGVPQHQDLIDIAGQKQLFHAMLAAVPWAQTGQVHSNLALWGDSSQILHRYSQQPPLIHPCLSQQAYPRVAYSLSPVRQATHRQPVRVVFKHQPHHMPDQRSSSMPLRLRRKGNHTHLQLALAILRSR